MMIPVHRIFSGNGNRLTQKGSKAITQLEDERRKEDSTGLEIDARREEVQSNTQKEIDSTEATRLDDEGERILKEQYAL